MATRMQQRRGTAAQWTSADPILNAAEIGYESDTNKFKIGDGVNHWSDLDYFASASAISDILDGAPEALNTLNELAAALGDDPTFFTTVATNLSSHEADTTNVHGIVDTTQLTTFAYVDAKAEDLSARTGTGLSWDATNKVINVDLTAVQAKVANVDDTEIGYLDGVTSSVQTQIDNKVSLTQIDAKGDLIVGSADNTITRLIVGTDGYLLTADAAEASGIKWAPAPVSLPDQTDNSGKFLTSDGTDASWAVVDLTAKQDVVAGVTDTEIGYLDGVTSGIQGQIDAKASEASLTSLSTTVDGKLNLSGGTLTGALTLSADPSSSLHAATKQYVDNTASGIVAKPQVLGATTANIDATYNNGTAGVGATLTHNTNGEFPAASGGASGWAVGKGILVKNQTNKAENGRYYVSDMGSPSTPYVLTRCGYCDEASEIPGAYIFVQDGTSAGTGWIQTVADATTFVVGTDDINVYQFSGSGTYTAGTGLTLTGNEYSINTSVTADLSTAQSLSNKTLAAPRLQLAMNSQSGTTYTLALSDASNAWVTGSNAAATTVTVPPSVFSTGDQINVQQTGAGQITFAQGAGVTITLAATTSSAPKIRARYASATVICVGTNSFTIVGDLI